MAKSKPIGVRFNQEILESTGLTAQKALNIYEQVYLQNFKKQNNTMESQNVTDNNVSTVKMAADHPLYKEGDPKENTTAFYLKYGYYTYEEIVVKK